MTRAQKYILCLAVLFLALPLKLPLWHIDIWAPQYPEGLAMQISSGSIDGDVQQINILNHYIGMKHIVPGQIPELKIMPWILGAIALAGVFVILSNELVLAKIWLVALMLGGAAGFVDFYRWGYDYGHNLSPDAPIKIPGFSYQPPLFGYKKILNIEAYSLPDWGAYSLALGILLVFVAIYRDPLLRLAKARSLKLLALSVFLGACTAKVEPLKPGIDHCDNCHMQITDARFGAELITEKGRIFKFDSIHCLQDYMAHHPEPFKKILVADYFHSGKLIEAKAAHFLKDSKIAGPMGSDAAASEDETALKELKGQASGKVIDWEGLTHSSSF